MPAAFPTERILVRGVNWLGDAVMTTPALLRLREAKPQAYITLLTPAKLADLWRHHPALDAVETFSAAESVWRIGRRLRAGKFDIGLVLPNSPRAALEIWLAGIPRRIGYQRPWRNWLLTEALAPRAAAVKMRKRSIAEIQQLIRTNLPPSPPSPGAHHIHQYLHLTAALGSNREPLPPKLALADDAIPQFIAKFKLPRNLYPPPVYFGLNAFANMAGQALAGGAFH